MQQISHNKAISVIFIAICVVIIMFIAAVFMSHVNSILYNIKLEMYMINKSAVIAVNKNETSIDDFSFNKKAYKEYFEDAIKSSYDLNDEFENNAKLISSVKVIEYDIYESGKKDYYTGEVCDDRTIHTVLEVKIRPIIMREFFEDIFTFNIHEDVNLNLVQVEV